jgi:2-succinyl-6-hydroxy-2,4-cyclohexadiene-1-carboxylate synthase
MTEFISEQRATLNTPESSPHILLGYSMGARAALLHATQFPEAWDALILISANPGIEDETMRTQRRSADADLADSIERGGVDTFLEYWQQTPLIRSQQNIPADWLVAMQANRQKHKAEGLANSLRQFGQGSFPNLWPSLPKLKMPICLVSGTLDTKYTRIGERMLPSFDSPRTTHLAIDGASHMPHLEQAEETALAIRSFLEQA